MVIIPKLTYVNKMAEGLDAMSWVKFGGFQSQLEVTCVSSHTEELWYNETVWMMKNIFALLPGVESNE